MGRRRKLAAALKRKDVDDGLSFVMRCHRCGASFGTWDQRNKHKQRLGH